MSFDKWKQRLAIVQAHATVKARHEAVATLKINNLLPDHEDEGYYRKPAFSGVEGGKPTITGWIPIAYWVEDGKLVGSIGAGEDLREMKPDEITNENWWSYAVQNPVSYDTFCAVAYEGQPWPKPAVAEPIDDTKPPETVDEHRAGIRALVDSTKDMKIIDEATAAKWLGVKNTLATLRLAADKAGKARYQPMHAAYVAERDQWLPMVNGADTAEKRIATEYKRFQNERRIAAEKAAAAIEQARQEEEERNQRIADRAIARGEEPPPPDVLPEGDNLVPPVAPAPVVPAAGTRAAPKLELQTFLDEIKDEAAVCAYFRGDPDLVAVLKTLIGRAIKKGQTVPGITTREGYV